MRKKSGVGERVRSLRVKVVIKNYFDQPLGSFLGFDPGSGRKRAGEATEAISSSRGKNREGEI
jgi:hypothetical protein